MKQKVLLGVLILVEGSGIFSILYARMNPEKDVFSYMSGLAMVVLVMVTMIYVYVTSRQLEEMEIERKLQNQPLPYINNVDVSIEKPRLYFSPPRNEYSTQARYEVKMKIRNIGSHPAVCTDVSARIGIPVEHKGLGRKRIYFSTSSINIPAIGEKEDYPITEDSADNFLFSGDAEGLLIQALREQYVARMPLLYFRILFRNVMGGCFVCRCRYRLYPKREEDDSLFSNWLTEMNSFWIKHKNDIDNVKGLRNSNHDKCDEEFNRLKDSFSASIGGENVAVEAWPMPGSFVIKAISQREYEKQSEDVAYGVRKTESMKCVAE